MKQKGYLQYNILFQICEQIPRKYGKKNFDAIPVPYRKSPIINV